MTAKWTLPESLILPESQKFLLFKLVILSSDPLDLTVQFHFKYKYYITISDNFVPMKLVKLTFGYGFIYSPQN